MTDKPEWLHGAPPPGWVQTKGEPLEEVAPELCRMLRLHMVAHQIREIQAYVALSQGALYNPRLTEMLRNLLAVAEGKPWEK